MTKKDETNTAEQEEKIVAARDENRIIADAVGKPIDEETASHYYQAGTNAVNTNVLVGHPNKDLQGSILDKIDTPENLEKRESETGKLVELNEREANRVRRSEIEAELAAKDDAEFIKKHTDKDGNVK